ncbi:hypothetical protein ACUOGT_14490 [Escherichia coli]
MTEMAFNGAGESPRESWRLNSLRER